MIVLMMVRLLLVTVLLLSPGCGTGDDLRQKAVPIGRLDFGELAVVVQIRNASAA